MKVGRRFVLRGVAAGAACTLSLPILEASLNSNGTAFADGAPMPKRFGVFFWANGTPWNGKHAPEHTDHADIWTPAALGAGWEPSRLLEPLRGIHHRVNVISGLEPKTEIPLDQGGQGDGHNRGWVAALTGDRGRKEGYDQAAHVWAVNRATIDQVIASHPQMEAPGASGHAARFRSLELACSRTLWHDFGHWTALSHRGPDQLNLPIWTASSLYDRLFDAPVDGRETRRRALLLDAVREDGRRVAQRVSTADRRRIDAHLQHLSELRTQLDRESFCAAPERPTDSDELMNQLDMQARLLAVALKCDLTRVFSMMFTSPASQHVFRNLGIGGSMHQLVHDGDWEATRAITEFHMQGLRRFLDVLAAESDVEGSVLDGTLVYATSEYGEGKTHNNREHPVLLAGGERHGHRTGLHVREELGNLSRVPLTIHRALGLSCDSFGWNGAETTQAFDELIAT